MIKNSSIFKELSLVDVEFNIFEQINKNNWFASNQNLFIVLKERFYFQKNELTIAREMIVVIFV